ncbi:alpha/beta fold hydrolase [Pelomonas sp. KK5]|uniref:S9 family peptidase n=1 Tax=Pelomonas sp. KK5 TaxID=1855730 RepID=UPI00097BDB05|nr:alpha/beta fold hydrolase [Pelomonas sp. KK5]
MKSLFLSLALAGSVAHAADISLERITSDPPLQGSVPRQAEISPGGGWVSMLRPSAQDSEQLELWGQPSAGGAPRLLASAAQLLGGQQQKLSEAEKMALERKRITQGGITSYRWCGDADQALVFPLSGDLYLLRLDGQPALRLTSDPDQPKQDPVCSPDGRSIAYVKGGNLWVQPLDGGPRALTNEKADAVSHGLAEFIAAEELGRQRGFWWSPDGKRILAMRVDESGVPLKTRAQIFADHTAMTEQRYPSAGENNAKVTAFAIDVADGRATALPLPPEAEYIVRAGWFADGTPWLQWMRRDQTQLALTEFAAGKPPRQLIDERDAAWVDTHDDLAELKGLQLSGKPALLWSSERSGRKQLLLVDRVSGARHALTRQDEAVAHLVCAGGGRIVFAGAVDRARGQELFISDLQGHVHPLEGSAPRQWRDASADRACGRLLVTRSAWGAPPRLALLDAAGQAAPIELPADPPQPLLAEITPQPQVLDIKAADGITPLNAFFLAPLDGRPGRHATLVLAYGGPTGATVSWAWPRDTALMAHWQRLGFGILMLDTRGMGHRDRGFTRAHYRAFGKVEVADLFAATRQLPHLVDNVDPQRIGFWGWSYGGFLAARAMLDADTPFAAAAGVAPPTDWMLYDTAYTERYLGLPEGGKAAPYRDSNLIARAGLLAKPLLLVHGTADDNVLFDNSLQLIQALQDEGKAFELMIYPGKAHGIAGRKARLHLYRTLDSFFTRTLKP